MSPPFIWDEGERRLIDSSKHYHVHFTDEEPEDQASDIQQVDQSLSKRAAETRNSLTISSRMKPESGSVQNLVKVNYSDSTYTNQTGHLPGS